MDKDTLFRYEPIIAKLFENSRKKDRLSSAFLLYGEMNSPLKEVALYLSESLSCENDLLACKECNSCKRFESGIHPDFIMIDGSKSTIKKEDIQNLEDKFALSALEKDHALCYVIHRIDNITEKAANTILKFLEEPKQGQIAFLTTCNLDKVLPTIRSRAVPIRIDPIDVKKTRDELLQVDISEDNGKKKKEPLYLNENECFFLSRFFPSCEEAIEEIKDNDSFLEGYRCAEEFLEGFLTSRKEASYSLLRDASSKKGASCYNWMYLIIHEIFSASLTEDIDEDTPFQDVIKKLKTDKDRIHRADQVVKEAISYRHVNYNQILLASRLISVLEEE